MKMNFYLYKVLPTYFHVLKNGIYFVLSIFSFPPICIFLRNPNLENFLASVPITDSLLILKDSDNFNSCYLYIIIISM